MNDLTAIVPYRGDAHGIRRRNLDVVLKWLTGAGIPTILAEHSDIPDVELHVPEGVRRLHVAAGDRPFNKASACNDGFLHAGTKFIALVDADTLMEMDAFLDCASAVRDDLDAVRPYGHLVELDEPTTIAVARDAQLPAALRGARDDPRAGEQIPLCGGLVILRAAAYESVGGMDESFEGWGGEDDALSMALIRSGLRCGVHDTNTAFHLFHPRSPESRYGHPHYLRNRERAIWWHEAGAAEIAAETHDARERLAARRALLPYSP